MTKCIAPYERSSLLEIPRIHHAFFGRCSGQGNNTFNVGRDKGDSDNIVLKNRQQAMDQLLNEKSKGTLCLVKQVHGTKVCFIDKPMVELIEADGLVTRTPGLVLGVMTADCLPLLMVHPQSLTIAAVHAGWRGVTGEIALEALRVMDVPPSEVRVAIGPCIWQVSFTVGQDVYNESREPEYFMPHPNESGKYLYDVAGHLTRQLQKVGVKHISPSPANTYDHPDDYFSFRRKTHVDERGGNQFSVIGIAAS